MQAVLEKRCRGCLYFDSADRCCGYALATGHSRGAVRGGRMVYAEPCDRFEPRGGERRVMDEIIYGESVPERKRKRTRKLRSYPEREALYAEGLTDGEIAKRLGVRQGAIAHWRLVRGLEANVKGERGGEGK